MTKPLLLGCAKVDITPEKPLALAGFAHRKGVYERIETPLHARVFFFRQDGDGAPGSGSGRKSGPRQALLVSADLLYWGRGVVDSLKAQLAERWGLAGEQVILHGTHNHSGPQTATDGTPSLGAPDPAYMDLLQERVLEGVERAIRSLEPVHVERGSGALAMGVYRRKRVDGRILMAPNPDVPVDPTLTVVRFVTESGRTKGALVHYACHPTISGENVLLSEYPGLAMELLEAKLGEGAVAAFLQGCCADVRPALVRDGEFYRGGPEEVARYARMLADEAWAVLSQPMQSLRPGPLAGRTLTVPLQLQPAPSEEELRRWAESGGAEDASSRGAGRDAGSRSKGSVGASGGNRLRQLMPDARILTDWSRLLLAEGRHLCRTVDLELTCLKLADDLALLAANAELSGAYGQFVTSAFGGRVLPVCYSNGMIGYVATADQIAGGGYEALDFIYYFGQPAPLQPQAEIQVRSAMTEVARNLIVNG